MFTFTAQLSIAKCHLVKKQNVHFEYVSGGRFIRLIQTQNTVLSIDSLHSFIWNLKFYAIDANLGLVSLQQALSELSIWRN